jgi:hypothetical protein
MRIILKPVSGTPKANLDRAKLEMERVLAFRGSVSKVKVRGNNIIVKIEVNPKWDLPMAEKVKTIFKVYHLMQMVMDPSHAGVLS